MAATSTNKQPLLVDHVLHVVANLDTATNKGIDIGNNDARLLVDSTSADGAIIEDVYLISRSKTPYDVNLYISTARDYLRPNESYFVGSITSGTNEKDVVHWDEMPFCLVPVPHFGDHPRNRAFYLPKGYSFWAARQSDTPEKDSPLIGVQGGWY